MSLPTKARKFQSLFDTAVIRHAWCDAIFKLDPDPPVGASIFVNERDVPADHYLWLTGQISGLFKGEREPTDALPKRE